MDNNFNDKKVLDGITCNVSNCIHHQNSCCTANQIKVGPGYACCCDETCCGTFSPKEEQ